MYGMGNVPEQILVDAANEMLHDERRVRDLAENVENEKVIAAVKEVVTLEEKEISETAFRDLK